VTLSGTGKPAELFYDDLTPGEVFDLGVTVVDGTEMLGFARRAAAAASPGLEELRWTAPVYAGDHLASRLVVTDRTPSRAQPGFGTVTLAGTMTRLGADGEPEGDVLRIRFRGWFALRPPATAPAGPS